MTTEFAPISTAARRTDLIAPAHLLKEGVLWISPDERETLRKLAGRVAELAARPIEQEKRDLWRRHNALQPTRPLIFCDPENGWNEIFPPASLQCRHKIAREWEFHLRKQVFWGDEMRDDYTIAPRFDIAHVHTEPDWGVQPIQIGGEQGGAYRWDPPLKSDADLERLHYPTVAVDFDATARLAALAHEIFGDLLDIRVATRWWWSVGGSRTLADWRGLDQMMYDMVDRPDLIHALTGLIRDGTLALLEELEARDLLTPNWDGSYVGSGGLGWSDQLPAPDFAGHVRLCDMWGFAESQETVGISPKMFVEFVFPYQLPLLERFGLSCYGCCEPLDSRWSVVKRIPNLRRVSMSPWANRARMAEQLGARYIFSMKPNPTDIALDDFDEERIRAILRADLAATRDCRVEVILKDTHTIRNDPRRVTRWTAIAREEAERV